MSFDSPRFFRPVPGLGAAPWVRFRSVLSNMGLLWLLLIATASGVRADTFEPNDTPQQATPIQNGQQLESFISSDVDEDWFGFTLAQATPIIATVSSVPPSEGIDYDVVLIWFDTTSQLYVEIDGSFAPGGQDELIQHDNTKNRTGSFYIVVYKYAKATFDPNDSYFVALTTGGGGGNQPPTITLTAPNGGESYAAGSQHNVTWTANDPDNAPQPTSVSLEYSTNSGGSWTAIGTATGAAGSFAWTVPSTPSTQAKVRATVSDGAATAQDESNATFTITGQPSGQNVLAIGSASGAAGATVTVSVSLDNDDVVKGYQTDIGFDAAVLLFQSATATGRGATMPASAAVVGGNRVRLIQFFQDANTLAAGTGAVCNVTFQIIATSATTTALTPSGTILSDAAGGSLDVTATGGTITVTGGGGGASPVVSVSAPNGGETWASASTHPIVFTATDADTPSGNLTITLEYSTNGGTSWTQIAGSQPNNGSYSWSVPTVASNQTQSRVRVTANDGQGHTGSDQSDANFTIQAAAGGQNVLSMGTNNGASGTQIVIPLRLNNQDAVKALQTDITFDPAVVSFVSGITSPEHAPNMGFSASVIGGAKVRVVMFYTDASVISPGNGAIANLTWSLIGANGTHSDLTPTASVLSDAQSQSLPVVEAAGSADIAGGGGNTAPTVSVSAPNGGESFASGTTQTITWTATDTETPPASLIITIELSTNGGSTFVSVANNEANDGSFTWSVPATATTQGRIRVSARDAGGLSGSDTSNSNFTITTGPAEGNVLSMGTGSGASGAQVTVGLNLANEDAVKAIQSDIQFDPAVVGFVSGAVTGRGEGMSFSASVVGGNVARLVMVFTDTRTIPAGQGAVANLTFNLIGASGTQSTLAPSNTILADAQAHELPSSDEAGLIQVTGGGGQGPTLHVFALKNPGRTRTLQIFVRASTPLSAGPTVTAGTAAVSMSLLDGAENLYHGVVHVPGGTGSVTISASGQNANGTGTGQASVTF